MGDAYYTGPTITVYHGDCRAVLPHLPEQPVAAVVDPPYGETSAAWDRWPDGWVDAVAAALPRSASLWCFGTARMFLRHHADFNTWKFGQEALWLKHNGTGPGSRDRLTPIHEWAYHWYRGPWSGLHHEWVRERCHGGDKSARRVANAVTHRRADRDTAYVDDGFRQPRAVTWVVTTPSIRGRGRHQDEKPVTVVADLVRECTPPGGLVLDCFAGTGTTGVAAQLLGRRAVLIDADEAMCEAMARRFDEDPLPGPPSDPAPQDDEEEVPLWTP